MVDVPLFRDDAIVLRVHKLGEADRIVTLLTRRHGRVRAVGKGVRRITSRFGARLEPASHVDVQLLTRMTAPGAAGKLDVITQTEGLDNVGARLSGDYLRWTAASAMCEIAERLTAEEGEPALRLYLLLLGALRALDEQAHAPSLVLDAYLIRAAALEGWAPALAECAKCDAPGPHAAFHIAAGGSVCESCRPAGSARPSVETIGLMLALLNADWPIADASSAPARREASGLIAAHLQWHLERGLRALPLVEREHPSEARRAAGDCEPFSNGERMGAVEREHPSEARRAAGDCEPFSNGEQMRPVEPEFTAQDR